MKHSFSAFFRILSVILSIVLIVSGIPISAAAVDRLTEAPEKEAVVNKTRTGDARFLYL